MTTMTTNQQPATRPPAATGDHDAEPVLVSGILDTRGSQAFVRTSGYRPSLNDVQVPAALLRQYGLRTGDHIEGAASPGVSDATARISIRASRASSTELTASMACGPGRPRHARISTS